MKQRRIVFIIDDNKDDREIIRQTIAGIDSCAKCFGNSNSLTALRRLYEVNPKPSLIFIDLRMPLISGKDWLQLFHNDSSLNCIPVIGCTSNYFNGNISSFSPEYAFELIPKPLPINTLKEKLRELLRIN